MNEKRIVFFDGVCKFCNSTVNFLLNHDTKNTLLFSPLQGKTAQQLFLDNNQLQPDSIIYYRHGTVYVKSVAILYILVDLGGFWKAFKVFFIIPRFVRDMAYDLIARNRYRFFGKFDTCRLPNPGEELKFLE